MELLFGIQLVQLNKELLVILEMLQQMRLGIRRLVQLMLGIMPLVMLLKLVLLLPPMLLGFYLDLDQRIL